jgi:hypothetical protein
MSSILLDEIPDVGPQHEVLTRREMTSGGVTSCKVVRGTVYINGNLKGDERNHTVARCLWYELGVTGETAHYPDSLFSASTNTNTQLSEIDRKAVAILYEPALANSMSVEDLRKVIYLP